MLKIIINAYAVCPNKGSEPGMGWNWIINISKYCEVFIITESEFKDNIISELNKIDNKDHIHFYFISITKKARNMCWNQGDWRFYYYYRKWQKEAYKKAIEICNKIDINVIHQLNMVGYREPGLMWKIKNIPTVWGPIGGFGDIPFSYLSLYNQKNAAKQFIKQIINKLQVYLPYIVKAIKHTNILIACNTIALESLQKFRKDKIYLINEVGTYSTDTKLDNSKFYEKKIKIAWIGRNIPSKALKIGIEVMSNLQYLDIEMHIIGVNLNKSDISIKNINNIYIHPWMPHEEVQSFLDSIHILMFTSLFEATGSVVLECLSKGIPVICHDTCGQGDIIDNTCGIKIEMKNTRNSITQFTNAIEKLYKNRNTLKNISLGAKLKSKELTWEKNAKKTVSIYNYLSK